MAKFKYPPCRINPDTDKPYSSHKWIIPTMKNMDGVVVPKTRWVEDRGLCYHIVCARCKLRDPNPERF